MKYKILALNAPHVLVEYSTDDDLHKAMLNVRVDKKLDGSIPQGAELDDYIMSFCPQLPPVDHYAGVDWTPVASAVAPKTAEQIAAEAIRDADVAARTAAKADNIVQYLRDHTPAECEAYVQANITDLASARAFLKKVAVVMCVLSKQSLR